MDEFRVYARRTVNGEMRKCFFKGRFPKYRKARNWCRNNLLLFGKGAPLVIVHPGGVEEDYILADENE